MADNRCFNADIISTILLGNNEGFAKEMVQLSQKKNAIQSLAWDTAKWKAQIKQIDMQIQSMFEARILYGSAWDEAKQALIKRLKARWGTIWAWARVLEMIDSISVNNINEYAELLGKQRGDVVNTQQAIDELKEAVSDFIAAKEWLKVNYWAKVFNKNLSMKERRKALWDWYKQELETVKKWWVPTTIVSPDDQWKHIERFTWAWQHKREELFNNYLLWRIFIWEDEDVTKDFIKEAKKFSNTLPKLTIDKINEYKNINTLLNRVYTNALDIARSPELRKALKLKIIELIHNGKTPNSVMKKAMSISNSMLLADSWVSFSTLLKYDNVDRAVRSILIDENGKSRVSEELTSEDLYNELKKILAKDNLKKSLVGRDWAKKIEAFWTKIDWEELLKIIYAASWDNDVKSAIELHWTISDDIIIDAAKFRLFWLDTKNWEKNLRDIIAAFKKPYSPDEVSTIAFVATSWKPVKPSVNNKIAFVHFDDTNNLTLEDEALMSRAKFNDDLAWVNTLTVTTDGIRTYDITNWVDSVPTDLEYIVIPNANVRNSRRMQELRDRLEKQWKNNKYMIIYPRSRQSGQYFVDTDWKLKFKTTNTKLFNEMSNALAINSFNNATIDLAENTAENAIWNQLSVLEKKNKLNDSAVEFFKNYLWIKGKISDEQIIQKISNMTGIPLNPAWGNSAEAWEQVQRTLFLNYTMSWKFGKEIKTKWELNTIENSIRWMSYNDIFKEISDMWYSYNKKNVIKNISAIREALINMKTTDNLASYMWNKWIIIWLSNKWAVDNLTVERFKSILVSDNPLAQLADIFFWWRKTTKKEVEAMATYMSDITDALIWDFMTRLTEDWYQLPMISPRKAFVSYLKWELSVTDEFVQAFAYKNWLDENYNYIKQIFDDHMPSDIIVDDLITPETLQSIRWWNKWLVVKELSANERFLPTTYNSYTAVMGNMDIPAQTFPRQSVRITADDVRDVLKQFFTDKELEWVSINFYDNLIDWIAEWRYTSDWMKRALDFIKNPEEVTPYHESVHMYIDMFLTKEQRWEFLDEIYKKNKGAISKFAKDNWYVIDEALEKSIRERWETVQQYLTEEWVAENFIKFAKWEDVKLNKATRNWFQKLWNIIRSWVKKIPEEKLDSLNQFYSDIYNRVRPEGWVVNGWWTISRYRRFKYNSSDRRDNVEWVPVSKLDALKEFDRRVEWTFWTESNDVIESLKQSFKDEWINEPLIIWYDPDTAQALLIEWNHRLAAAKELWIKELPVRVVKRKANDSYKNILWIKKVEWNKHWYIPSDLKPSDIWLKSRSIKNWYTNNLTEDAYHWTRALYSRFKNEFLSSWAWWQTFWVWAYVAFDRRISEWYIDNFWYSLSYKWKNIDWWAPENVKLLLDSVWWDRLAEHIYNYWSSYWEADDMWFDSFTDALKKYVSDRSLWTEAFNDAKKNTLFDMDKAIKDAKNNKTMSKEAIDKFIKEVEDKKKVLKQLSFKRWALYKVNIPKFEYRYDTTMWRTKRFDYEEYRNTVKKYVEDYWKAVDEWDDALKEEAVNAIEAVQDLYMSKNYFEYWAVITEDTFDKILKSTNKIDPELWRELEFFRDEYIGKELNQAIYDHLWRSVYRWLEWSSAYNGAMFKDAVMRRDARSVVTDIFKDAWYEWIHYFWRTDKECAIVLDPSNDFSIERKMLYRRAGDNWLVENAWLTEEDVIRNILTKYEESVTKHIKDWTMTVKVAQDLKQQASYALNIAVQDLILSKYWNLLTASDREWLLWMWYWLKLAWNANELNALKQANAELMWKFRTRWWELAQQNNQLFSNVDELNKQLMDSWRVYTQRNWIEAVVDVWDELENSIKSIPDTAWEFTELKKLSRQTIKWLKPRDAYVMLKVVDLVKNNITRWNFYTQLMYQLNPQLRKAVNWLDFFQSYKAVDVWGWVWVPWSLTSNATNWVVEAGKAVDDASDIKYKADITREIYENYIRVGKELTQKDLESVVKKVLKWTLNEWYAQHYVDSFAPYTSLKWLSNEVKTYINQLLNQESSDIQKLLKEAWADLDWIMATTVTLDDWSTVAIKDIVNWNVDWWKQRMFWWLSNRWDELYANNQANRDVQKELEWAYAWFNDVSVVEDNQAKATIQILWHARKILQRDTHTQKFIEFDNAIWWQNDILKWLMEFHVFWQWKAWMDNKYVNKLIKTWARRTVAALGWYSKWFFNKQLWSDVKKIYEVYYSKPLKELNQIATPNDWAHQVALEMAKYFKQLEQRLGSKNWATWVSVIPWVNIAFWNLWNIVRNINTAEWVTSLMNKIGNNQVIWLFKFAREWDSSYNRFLHDLATNKKSEKWLSNALDWRRTELIQWDRKEIQQKFNEMFGSNFSEWDVNIIIQWLWWYQIVNSTFWKVLNKINSYIWSAGRVTRMLMSYPFQLFTIHPQLFAYNVKADTFKEALWVEDLSIIRKLRKKYWVLEWTYVELNPKEEFKEWINAILWRDSDEIDNLDIKLDDWVLWLYWKTTSYVTKKYTIPQKIALFDSVRDNANNIIDASQAQTFKWLAFTKALQTNDYIKFMNAEAFDEFMQRSDISQAVKDKLLDRVNIYSNRIFNNMLGTWFSGLDKAYWAWAISDFFMWVLQTINFKWAWWTNMFRQTFEKILTMIKVWWNYALGNREVAEDIWRYAVNTPEWTNFTEALWWDLVWSWKMWKYAKNWNLPDDESEVEMMDFIWRVADNAELVSQQWQWLISFWWTRPVLAAVEATYDTRDKWAESIWYWAWAFINSFISNIWRWWKPWNLWVDAIMVAERDWIWAWWDYLRENFYTLSAWTMRYMIEEWYNAYWANTPLTNQRWWIPAFMIGNQYEGSDTAFSYKVKQYQTWEYLKNLFNKDERMYAAQNLSSMYNVSQFLKLWVNSVKAAIWLWANIVWANIPDWAKSKKWVYSLLDIQEDFANSPTFQSFIKTGKALPPDMKKRDKLIDVFVNAQYPWWYKAYDWLQNFKNTGHINWNKDKWYYYDQWLEEFYTKIDKMKPGEIDRIMKLYSSQYLWDPNSEEGRITIYNWARSWLNEMTGDPNYNLYASALYKWNLNNIYYELLDTEASLMTEYRKSLWFSKEQAKVSRTDINNLDDVKDRINQQFINAFYDQMYRADSELMQNQIYQWIADELEPEVANWYFTQQPETNYAGNETGEMEWVLNSNIKSQLKDFIFIEKSIDDWRREDALAKTAILTQSLNYDDEMWLIRASIVDFYADRIMNSDLSPQMKLSSLSWLIDNNEDVFTYDSELAEKYWDAYDAAVAYKNDVLHNVTIDEIDDLNDLAILLHKIWESDSKWTASKWVKLSSKLAWLSWKLASSPSGWKSSTKRQSIQWAAVPIKWLSAMGYKPAKKPANFNFEVIYKSKWYDPKTKTLWPITPPKKNKAVKGKSTRKMTQKEENELDLI